MFVNNRLTTNQKNQHGYVALISTIIMSMILLGLTFSVSASGFFSRFDVLNAEFKRVALGLAESCANVALLNISQDYAYQPAPDGDEITFATGTCTITSITYSPEIDGQKTAIIRTSANYNGAYSNIEIAAAIQAPSVPTTPKATLSVVVFATGTLQASNFTVNVDGSNVGPNAIFSGSGGSGTTVSLDAGPFNVTISSVPNYTTNYTNTSDQFTCTGVAEAGRQYICYITQTEILQTAQLTVNAVVIRDNNGPVLDPNTIPLTLDGNPVVSGTTVNGLAQGTHLVSAPMVTGYTVSDWQGDCDAAGVTVSFAAGQSYTCFVTYDDVPPITPACADTVMILDRTGSMSDQDLQNEKFAAITLLNLYNQVIPRPQVGVGSLGGLNTNKGAWVPINYGTPPTSGLLTTNYGQPTSPTTGLYRIVDLIASSPKTSGTNISAAITAGANELNSVRHIANRAKVLILATDGEATEPSPKEFAASQARSAAAAAKAQGVEIFTVYYQDNQSNMEAINLLKEVASGPDNYFYSPSTAEAISHVFNTIGKQVCPAAGGITPPPPTTGTLIVKTFVTNDNDGGKVSGDFTMHVGPNAAPASFAGSETGVSVILQPGGYAVNLDADSEYLAAIGSQCVGAITAGQTITCTVNLDDIPTVPTFKQFVTPPPQPDIAIGSWLERE